MRIKHESIAREAFGNGILFAVENLRGKPKSFRDMETLLRPYFTHDRDGVAAPHRRRRPRAAARAG